MGVSPLLATAGCTLLLREGLGLALGPGKYSHVLCPTGLDFIKSSCVCGCKIVDGVSLVNEAIQLVCFTTGNDNYSLHFQYLRAAAAVDKLAC